MIGLKIRENKRFVGRAVELKRLRQIDQEHEAKIILVYGRRRIGKTLSFQQPVGSKIALI